ncbi:hypothetical protein N7G274_008850 [Stereocaulon virgatum]|uniref:Uncharacterized protein n=1 Tax=Stereocaulon virgatum TaxID=373712 RepID=A0ABR4A0M9_9LECA
MLDWFTGSSRLGNAQFAQADEGQSYLDDPPDTPAPLFAVRAFKTAIFGTPHPVEREPKRMTQGLEKVRAVTDQGQSEQLEVGNTIDKDITSPKRVVARPKLDHFSSPAKGILLTPGTAATRRKTVSFLHLEKNMAQEFAEPAVREVDLQIDPALTPPKKESDAPTEEQPRQPKLTVKLIELSKQNSGIKKKGDQLRYAAGKGCKDA